MRLIFASFAGSTAVCILIHAYLLMSSASLFDSLNNVNSRLWMLTLRPVHRAHKLPCLVSRWAHRIPPRMVFTYKFDLLKAAPASLSWRERIFHKNLLNTVKVNGLNGQVTVDFYDDARCHAAISEFNSSLAGHFDREPQGMFKADICRGAALWKEGGLYMDIDLEARQSVWDIIGHKVEFASVREAGENAQKLWDKGDPRFFQALLGTAPQSELMRMYLQYLLEYYNGKRQVSGYVGVHLMGQAYHDTLWHTEKEAVLSHIFREEKLTPATQKSFEGHVAMQRGTGCCCNFIVVDAKTYRVPFYSRAVDASEHNYCVGLFDADEGDG